MPAQRRRTTCVIVGGGPAGLVLGLLLARRGIRVTVLEKHRDFLRDFRGDTVHPSTLRLLDDLGLFGRFDALPQSRVRQFRLPTASGDEVVVADLARLSTPHPYVAMVPQWDLLDLLAEAAAVEPTFTLLREHEVTGVLRGGGAVRGVTFRTPDGDGEIRADLTVACDGRWSVVRRALDLPLASFAVPFAVPFDVWWFRVTTDRRLAEALLPRIRRGRIGIAIPRTGYVQVAWIGRKGTDAAVRARGIEAFRAEVAELLPDLAGDVGSIASLDDVKHLDVRLDRLRRWHANGVLCIGDAAHAMSPVGGVGINLAIQDAVATARLLAEPLSRGTLTGRDLGRVQRRRRFPAFVIQTLQRVVHARVITPVIAGHASVAVPKAVGILLRVAPVLSVVPAYLIGIGPRPERAPRWARR